MTNETKLNAIAQEIWDSKEFLKTPSCEGQKKYSLSVKQFDLINHSVRKFEELYSQILTDYKSQDSNEGLFMGLKNMINGYFAKNRDLGILNKNITKESNLGGLGRVLIVFYHRFTDEKNAESSEKKQNEKDAIKPIIAFFGQEFASATNFFQKFVVSIAIRFQFIIEQLEKNEGSLARFAEYIAYMCIGNYSYLNDETIKKNSSPEAKLALMLHQLVEQSKNDTSSENNLLQVGTAQLSIKTLLCFSPIETPVIEESTPLFWFYSGNAQNQNIETLPHQLCNTQELEPRRIIYKSIKVREHITSEINKTVITITNAKSSLENWTGPLINKLMPVTKQASLIVELVNSLLKLHGQLAKEKYLDVNYVLEKKKFLKENVFYCQNVFTAENNQAIKEEIRINHFEKHEEWSEFYHKLEKEILQKESKTEDAKLYGNSNELSQTRGSLENEVKISSVNFDEEKEKLLNKKIEQYIKDTMPDAFDKVIELGKKISESENLMAWTSGVFSISAVAKAATIVKEGAAVTLTLTNAASIIGFGAFFAATFVTAAGAYYLKKEENPVDQENAAKEKLKGLKNIWKDKHANTSEEIQMMFDITKEVMSETNFDDKMKCFLIEIFMEEIVPEHPSRAIFLQSLSSDSPPKEKLAAVENKIQAELNAISLGVIDNHPIIKHKEIGSGKTAKVYLVSWNKQMLAYKQHSNSSTSDLKALKNEVRILEDLKKLGSPYIVKYHGAHLSEPYGFLMDYMVQGSLRKLLDSCDKNSLPWPVKFNLMEHIVRGLIEIHKQNIIHGDLRSHNVLIEGEGDNLQAKIADFGLANTLNHTNSMPNSRGESPFFWRDPDIRRTDETNKRNDIYSFGVVALEIVTHELPFAQGIFLKGKYSGSRNSDHRAE